MYLSVTKLSILSDCESSLENECKHMFLLSFTLPKWETFTSATSCSSSNICFLTIRLYRLNLLGLFMKALFILLLILPKVAAADVKFIKSFVLGSQGIKLSTKSVSSEKSHSNLIIVHGTGESKERYLALRFSRRTPWHRRVDPWFQRNSVSFVLGRRLVLRTFSAAAARQGNIVSKSENWC